MKLRQFQYVAEVVKCGMNVTAAAEKLSTSQPGVSSQIKRLEEELGIVIFERSGKHINGLTHEGKLLLSRFELILNEVEKVKKIADDSNRPDVGTLSIATTHTQARYVLPSIINQFREQYPKVRLQIHQGTPEQIAANTDTGKADIGIATEALEMFDNLVLLPCYRWNRSIIVPHGHPLIDEQKLTHKMIAKYPVVTYVFGVADRSAINRAFKKHKLDLNVVLTAADAEVIKTYIRSGLGIGICATLSYDKQQDSDLVSLDASHLFDASVCSLAVRKNSVLRQYVYDFIKLFSNHLSEDVVKSALTSQNDPEIQKKLLSDFVEAAALR